MVNYEPLDIEARNARNLRRFGPLVSSNRRRGLLLGGAFFFLLIISFGYLTQKTGIETPPLLPEGEEIIPQEHKHDVLTDFSHGGDPSYPPTWKKMEKWQAELPQHNASLPFPEGRQGRYVFFSNQVHWLGWNNVVNEMLMNTHLAYESKRAYVFIDYWWNHDHNLWHKDRSKWPDPTADNWYPRTPLNAIISGPTSGMPWDEGDDAPRSVHQDYWNKVCPPEEVRYINTRDVKPAISGAQGDVIFNHWKKLLLEAPERCIEIQAATYEEDTHPQVFDLWLWGSDRVLSLWDTFSKSPTARLLSASPIVNSAVDRNEYLFLPRGPRLPGNKGSRNVYDRMMAMHVRRGDFKDACTGLANWNSTFYSWNLMPSLPDIFYGPPPPPGGNEMGTNTPENVELFMLHCLPSVQDIRKKARDSREDYIRAGRLKGEDRTLDVMYLLSNDNTEWIEKLKAGLREDGWTTVRTSRDLELDQTQMDVSMAVDMEIARRAAVFVGNGWSSFTSNINFRRLREGREPLSIRFW